jgi:hypothetical protein
MRTIASTFSTQEEAETASRRLQSAGVPSDRITLKQIAGAVGPDSAPAGGVFLSAKVAPDQVAAATEIFKGGSDSVPPTRAEEPPANAHPAPTETFGGPPPRAAARPAPAQRPAATAPPQPQRTKLPSEPEWMRLGRKLVYLSLILLAAVMAGALLGLVL